MIKHSEYYYDTDRNKQPERRTSAASSSAAPSDTIYDKLAREILGPAPTVAAPSVTSGGIVKNTLIMDGSDEQIAAPTGASLNVPFPVSPSDASLYHRCDTSLEPVEALARVLETMLDVTLSGDNKTLAALLRQLLARAKEEVVASAPSSTGASQSAGANASALYRAALDAIVAEKIEEYKHPLGLCMALQEMAQDAIDAAALAALNNSKD